MEYFAYQVKFEKKLIPEKIEIYESYNSGAVKRMQILQEGNTWYTVWQTDAVQHIKELRTFSPPLQVCIE